MVCIHSKKLLISLVILLLLVIYTLWGNFSLQVTEITVPAVGLPTEFDGYTIAHVSDLHNASFGKDNQHLLTLLAENRPDVIFLTGDIVDSRRTDVDIAVRFIADAAKIAPVYSVTGNHEAAVPEEYAALRQAMLEHGVTVLEDTRTTLSHNGAVINLVGLRDGDTEEVEDSLTVLGSNSDRYTILLAHRPERIGSYAGAGADLVFSGHAHGGQFRLPFVGGLVAPGQGIFPTYDAGLYDVNGTHLIVSRGLGNSRFPFRLNNRPELVMATLQAVS